MKYNLSLIAIDVSLQKSRAALWCLLEFVLLTCGVFVIAGSMLADQIVPTRISTCLTKVKSQRLIQNTECHWTYLCNIVTVDLKILTEMNTCLKFDL